MSFAHSDRWEGGQFFTVCIGGPVFELMHYSFLFGGPVLDVVSDRVSPDLTALQRAFLLGPRSTFGGAGRLLATFMIRLILEAKRVGGPLS